MPFSKGNRDEYDSGALRIGLARLLHTGSECLWPRDTQAHVSNRATSKSYNANMHYTQRKETFAIYIYLHLEQ